MDFHGLKRKELQVLCKKHGIPANLKNLEMADRLSSLLKVENPTKKGRSCLKNLSVVSDDEVLESKEPKRVKFSPQNETFVFEKTDPRELRLMARKKRAFGKSKMEENPVVVVGIVGGDVDNESVDDLDKPGKRTSRRKSVVPDPIAVSDTENAVQVDKPDKRVLRRKSVVPDPIAVSDPENVVQVDKPVKRVSRRKSVVPDPVAVSDTENVVQADKPVKRVSRRKSVMPDPAAVSDTESGDQVDKPVKRVSRRKSVMPDSIAVSDTENVVQVDKPVKRVSRRMPVVVKSNVEDTEIVDKVDLLVKGLSRQKSIVDKPNTVVCTEVVGEVEKPAGRILRRRAYKDKAEEVLSSKVVDNVDTDISVKVDRPVQRTSKRKCVLTKQNADLDTEIINEVEKPAKRILRSVEVQSGVDKLEKLAAIGKNDHVQDVLLSPCAVNKAKQSSKVQEKVGRGDVEEVDRPADELVGLVGNNNRVKGRLSSTEMMADIPENGDDGIQVDRGQGRRIEEVVDQAIDEKNAQGKSPDMAANIKDPKLGEKKAENCIEAAGLLPNSSEKPFTMQSEDYLEEINIKDKGPETGVAAFDTPINNGSLKTQNSGEHAAENSMQANKVEEKQETSLHQNIVADMIYDEGPASTPHSLWKINISGTLCGDNTLKTFAAGETTCSSALKSSILGGSEVNDAAEKQSSSLGEMMDDGIFGSTEGLECYHLITNEELVGQENGCEGSSCLSNSFKIETTAVEGKNDCAAMIFETSNVKSTKQEGTDGSKIDCAAVIFESSDVESSKQEGTDGSKGSKIDSAAANFETSDVKSTTQEGTDGSKGSRDIISEENVVFGSEAILKSDLQPPIVVDEMTYASNASPATNKITEVAKDAGEDRTEPSSINTFLLQLESQVADAMRVLSGSMVEGEGCEEETFRGDIACVANSTGVKNLAEVGSHVILEQVKETNIELEGGRDDVMNYDEGKEMKYEKAIRVTEQDAFGSSNGGETPVVFQEWKWAQVAGKRNISPLDMAEDMNSIFNSDHANPVNLKEEVSDASHLECAVSSLDVGNICIEVSERIPVSDPIPAENDQEFYLKEDDKSSDLSTISRKETLHSLNNLGSNFVDPSCSMAQESQKGTLVEENSSKGTPSRGLTCSANDANLECAADGRECITAIQPEEAHCSNESKSERLVSEGDISDYAQSMDQQFEMVPLPKEEITIFDNLAAQTYSVAKEVETLAPETAHIEEAEGASSSGNESLDSITCNELDEVLGTEFDWQTNSAGSIKKEFKNDPQQVGTVEGEKKGSNVDEKENSKTNSASEFGVTMERGLASQSSFLITIPEESKSGYGDQIAKVCLMEDTDQGHIAGNGKAINSCVGQLDMAERSDTLKDSGKLLLENVASGFDNEIQSIVVACPPMDWSPCYFANVNGSTGEIASGSLQEKKCHKTLQNASIGNIDVLCSSEAMLLEDNNDSKGDMVETGVEKSDALPSESSMHNEIVPETSVSKMHCKSESIAWEKEIEFSSTKEMELQDLASPILMVDLLSFGKNDKETREGEGAVDYVSEQQNDNHMNAGNMEDQESVYEGNIGCGMEAMEEDTCTEGIENSAPNSSESLDCLPDDIDEVSDVATYIVHDKSINSDAELEFNVNKGNCMLGVKVSDGELVDGKTDPIEKDSCMAEKDHPALEEGSDNGESSTIPEHIVFRENPAYKDDTQELDSARSPYFRDAQDDGCSVISPEKQAFILPMISAPNCSESLIPIPNTLGNNKNIKVAGVHEMVQDASSDNPFALLEHETDDANSEPHLEDGRDDVFHVGRGPNSPAICENKEVNDSSQENALSHPIEEPHTFAIEEFTKPPERQIGSNFNDYDANDNRSETDFSSSFVPDNFIDRLQQQNHSPLMLSCQQEDPSGSACQSDTTTTATALLDNGDMKSNIEHFIFTDSEIDLLFGEMEKDEVRTSQTEASDAVFSVNEYEIANLEDDSGRQERVRDSVGEVGNNQKCLNVEENENLCPFDSNNLGKVAEKNEDLDSDDKVLMSSMIRRKNIRSILIHGTPTKPSVFVHDMKENPPAQKRLQTVNATAVKPNVRRKVLGDIAK